MAFSEGEAEGVGDGELVEGAVRHCAEQDQLGKGPDASLWHPLTLAPERQ